MAIFLKEAFSSSRILVAGDLMLDRYWFGRVDRISPEAPVPIFTLSKTEERLGGAGNVAKNLKHIGVNTGIVSICGKDAPGESLTHLLEQEAITTYLQHDPSLDTTLKMRIIAQQQQIIRVDIENQPSPAFLASFFSDYCIAINDFDSVVLSDYRKGSLADIKKMIYVAKNSDKPVFIDPKGHDYSLYRHADAITPNRKELRQAIGEWTEKDELIEKVQLMRKKFEIGTILLTLSEAGMMIFSDSGEEHIGTNAKEVYDVSGAGDTVIGVYAAAITIGLTQTDAARIANRAAGIVVGKLGTYAVRYDELSQDINTTPIEELESEIIV